MRKYNLRRTCAGLYVYGLQRLDKFICVTARLRLISCIPHKRLDTREMFMENKNYYWMKRDRVTNYQLFDDFVENQDESDNAKYLLLFFKLENNDLYKELC